MKLTPEQLKVLLDKARASNALRTTQLNPAHGAPYNSGNSGAMTNETPYDVSNTTSNTGSNVPATVHNNSISNNLPTPAVPAPVATKPAISYNAEQQQFVDLATTGKSCVLIGAAGTGKTTCMEGVALSLIQSGNAGLYINDGHKSLVTNSPGIVVVAFTRRAVANIRKRMPADLKKNCLTIHALLEFEPVFDEVFDPETGTTKKTMNFLPKRDEYLPLSPTIHTVIIEESSMVSGTPFPQDRTLLFNRLKAALPHNPQFIYLGDIQQLPPVFGAAILGFKMLEHPVIELTQVYRQALESPIIRLAHRILSGKGIPVKEFPEWCIPNQLTLHAWKKKISSEDALATITAFFNRALDTGIYNPDEDIILIPYNKACGTDELNKGLASHIAKKEGKEVWEVVAGFNKLYFSVGDKIMVDKEDAWITKIEKNPQYVGKNYQSPSVHLNYWGYNSEGVKIEHTDLSEEDMDMILERFANSSADVEERVTQASHKVYYRRTKEAVVDGVETPELSMITAGELNSVLLGYALTVHKSQGSEWRKVFCIFHNSHAAMVSRELLYTAVTRAREELYVICEPETFEKGINSQRIKGNTLAEKAEYFKGKLDKLGN